MITGHPFTTNLLTADQDWCAFPVDEGTRCCGKPEAEHREIRETYSLVITVVLPPAERWYHHVRRTVIRDAIERALEEIKVGRHGLVFGLSERED